MNRVSNQCRYCAKQKEEDELFPSPRIVNGQSCEDELICQECLDFEILDQLENQLTLEN